MTFRSRIVLTFSATAALAIALAFGAASFVVVRSEERQLDDALRAEARQEAVEIAVEARGKALRISDRGGPEADDVGRLTKYAALYDPDGAVVDRTATFTRGVPERAALLGSPGGPPFDLRYGPDRLRAMLVVVPGATGTTLLLGASREDLEKDSAFLRRVMLVAAILSIGVTILATWSVSRRLTRGHTAIADVARKVAAGDLAARVAMSGGDDEVVQLAADIDEMVRRLSLLVDGQRRFVAYAAHELRSPLTSLYGELQLALRRSRDAEEYRAAIEESLEAAKRLRLLADDLLTLVRSSSEEERDEERVELDLEDVVAKAITWLEPDAARKRVRLVVEVDDAARASGPHAAEGLASGASKEGESSVVTTSKRTRTGAIVRAAPRDLERLLRNLLDNAVQHSPEGGAVVVRLGASTDVVSLAVSDEGPGVAAEDRARVFEPFFRSAEQRRRGAGSGLGLAIVREIARAHGGDVTIEDGAGGVGAVFRVELPTGEDVCDAASRA